MDDQEQRTVAIVGAGAIGAWFADALDRAEWCVSVLARGATRAALREGGLLVERDGESRRSHPKEGSATQLGPQDYVILAVKAQGLPDLVPTLTPLFGDSTVVVSATNGIPWWFFEDFSGPLENCRLQAVDPDGSQRDCLPRGRVLGAVVHASVRVAGPAHVQVVAADRVILGEPAGTDSARLRELVEALRAGGINALPSQRIRAEVWGKLWGNMNMNPVSALTRSGAAQMLNDPDVRALCERMMEEMQRCGAALGLNSTMTPGERIEVTRRLGDFRTSMLADLQSGRRLELAPQLGAVVEIAAQLGIGAPFCSAILGLTRLLDKAATM